MVLRLTLRILVASVLFAAGAREAVAVFPVGETYVAELAGEAQIEGETIPIPSMLPEPRRRGSVQGAAPAGEEDALEQKRQERMEQRLQRPSAASEDVVAPMIPGSVPPPPVHAAAPEPVHSGAQLIRSKPLAPTGMASTGIVVASLTLTLGAIFVRKRRI